MSVDTMAAANILDLAQALQNLDGDAELLQEIVGIFLDTADEMMASIAAAIQAGDVSKVAIEAHAMKGGASNFCAGDFVKSSLALELLAKSGTLDGADELLAAMVADLTELRDVLTVVNWESVAAAWQG